MILFRKCTVSKDLYVTSSSQLTPTSNLGVFELQKPTDLYPTPTTGVTTPTAMAEPVNPYIFETEKGQTNLSSGNIVIRFDEGALKGKSTKVTLISPENLGGYLSTSDGLKVGTGVGVIRPENYGNLIMGLHSGYFHKKPLEAEIFRLFLEYVGENGTEYVLDKLQEISGSKGILITPEGLELNVEITGGVRLQPTESEELRLNPANVLDIITRKDGDKFLAIGNVKIFENIKTDGHEILINFCGWGPNQETTYYRYVILLNVEQP